MATETRSYPVEILLVEDNPDDAFLATEALREGPSDCRVTHVEDGVEALDFLCGRGKHAAAARPHLVLLDINLPKMKGLEVLREMKADRILRGIPVIMMTSSSDPRDILEALNGRAHKYLAKPVSVAALLPLVQEIVREYRPTASPDDGLELLDGWIREFERY